MNFQKEYWRRARVVAFWLQLAPFVRMIGLNGSLARGAAKKTSDIDFFIVIKKNRIWTGRMLVSFMVELSGYRRTDKKIAGMICLNRYQTDDYLEIFPHNQYHAWDYCGLMPLVDIANTYQQYLDKNRWTQKLGHPMRENRRMLSPSHFLSFLRNLSEKILGGDLGDWVEKILRRYQRRRILSDKRTMMAPKGKIRISDRELCFHPAKRVDKLS